MNAPTLFDTVPGYAAGRKHGEAWWEFHRTHPEVGDALRRMALQLVDRGHRHLGVKMLWEKLRFESMLGAAPGEEPYRLNNLYTAYYARWLMDTTPALEGVFETRQVAA